MLDEMLAALKILASGPGLVAITLTELNPRNAAADNGLLERFVPLFRGRDRQLSCEHGYISRDA